MFSSVLCLLSHCCSRERSGSVVECLTRDPGATGSSLTGITVLCPWARHINPSWVLVQPRKTRPFISGRLLMELKESNQTKSKNVFFCSVSIFTLFLKGGQWLSGRVLDSRRKGGGFEPHRRHCVVSLSKNINPTCSLVLVRPRKTSPFITERLAMIRKESNQTNMGAQWLSGRVLNSRRGAAGSSLTGVTAFWSLSKTHLS